MSTTGTKPRRRPEYRRTSRVCGIGADGSNVIVRDVPDSGSDSDAREVDRVVAMVAAVDGVERVQIAIRNVPADG